MVSGSVKPSALLWSIAGLIGWAAAFVLVYGLHGLGCAGGWDQIPAGPTNLQRAEAQGVDTGRITRAVAKLRSPHVAVQEAGLDELQAIEEEFAGE